MLPARYDDDDDIMKIIPTWAKSEFTWVSIKEPETTYQTDLLDNSDKNELG